MPVDLLVDDGVVVDEARVVALAEGLLAAADLDAAEWSLRMVDDATMRDLNRTWRDKDSPTDVLSFPMQEGHVSGGLLGDVVVSVDTATRQAAEQSHDLLAEVAVLLAHGLAHLLGHDHQDAADRTAMAALEARLLAGADRPGLLERTVAPR